MLSLNFDGNYLGPLFQDTPIQIHAGTNCKLITLDASANSALKWNFKESALNEKKILWAFDFGLEDDERALNNKTLFQSRQLAIDYFVKNVWPNFQDTSLGAVLYCGPFFPLHQRHAFLDYLQLLAVALPPELSPLLLFDDTFENLESELEWLSTPLLEPFIVGLEGASAQHPAIRWKSGQPFCQSMETGVVLPLKEHKALSSLHRSLERDGIAFRYIPEELICQQWGGLETLYVIENSLSSNGLRALAGFEAAGGTIITR